MLKFPLRENVQYGFQHSKYNEDYVNAEQKYSFQSLLQGKLSLFH